MNISLFILIFLMTNARSIDLSLWEKFATDILSMAINDEVMWKVVYPSTMAVENYPLKFWDSSKQNWDNEPSAWTAGIKVAVSSGYEWYINADFQLYRRPFGVKSWENMEYASEISFIKSGANEYAWMVSNEVETGDDYKIYTYDLETNAKTLVPGIGGVKVAAALDGTAWVITNAGFIKKFDGTDWTTIPGEASDIQTGTDGSVYIVSKIPTDGGYTILKRSTANPNWQIVTGIGGSTLALDGSNTPYVVTDSHEVYRLKGKISNFCPGKD